MSIEMPGALQQAFSYLGMDWPQADEDKLDAAGDRWSEYAARIRDIASSAQTTASDVWNQTSGESVDAFRTWWQAHPDTDFEDAAAGADLVASALHGFAAVTVTLKGVYIAQLGILAAEIIQALATAVFTFGASVAEIPVFATTVRFAVKTAVDEAVSQVLA